MFYKTLFNINFLHAFFLDEGIKKYIPLAGEEAMNEQEKQKAMLRYNFRDFLQIIPTPNTLSAIKNHRLKIILGKKGFSLIASSIEKTVSTVKEYQPLIHLSNELTFTFAIYAKDTHFHNYTLINTIDNNRLHLFSNTLQEITSPIDAIFTGDGIVDDNYCLSEDDTRLSVQMIHNEEQNSNYLQFSITRQIDLVNENVNLSVAEKKEAIKNILNQYINTQKRKGLLGFIRLKIKGDSNDLVNEIGTNQYIVKPTLSFTLKFQNRKTFWRYIKNTEVLNTTERKPLTKNGFIPIKVSDLDAVPLEDYQYLNPNSTDLIKEADKYYSEIYI